MRDTKILTIGILLIIGLALILGIKKLDASKLYFYKKRFITFDKEKAVAIYVPPKLLNDNAIVFTGDSKILDRISLKNK
ncbi:MAG: hypothetical protein GY750_06465 [Lentisphaerae bacterium]|nr:hypothetical protein [Lentisphaerota bacterium]MCP4101052.1 hypothetical protein [Lentisphaerota bacterium]